MEGRLLRCVSMGDSLQSHNTCKMNPKSQLSPEYLNSYNQVPHCP